MPQSLVLRGLLYRGNRCTDPYTLRCPHPNRTPTRDGNVKDQLLIERVALWHAVVPDVAHTNSSEQPMKSQALKDCGAPSHLLLSSGVFEYLSASLRPHLHKDFCPKPVRFTESAEQIPTRLRPSIAMKGNAVQLGLGGTRAWC